MIRARRQVVRVSDVVRFLRNPKHYPEGTRRVDVIETHFAWIFLTDLHAYKLKKPVRRGRMDYTTIAARRQVCLDELTLNRRLAPAVYLEVLPITRSADCTLALGRAARARASGSSRQVVDWVVKMRRLPAARMLDHAITARALRKGDVRALVSLLTHFFDHAVRQRLSEARYVERMLERTARNKSDLCAPDLGLDAYQVAKVIEMQLVFLQQKTPLVAARGAHLIDGHGDLRPEHVYQGSGPDSPCVIDCLEFDSDLRWVDPAEEIAFLALECRKLGAAAVARALVAHYRADTLTPPSAALMDFYTSQSAMTRAKLAAWHVRDPELARDAGLWRARANRYLRIAARHIRRANRPVRSGDGSAESGAGVGGPVLEQRGQWLSGQHALDCLAE
ncbi:MAG TPA: hypothetical protein VI653_08695 [Steroidobacteraceae bacterium]